MNEEKDVQPPGRCQVTSGMLSRWLFGQEPGGGFTQETLADHIRDCGACSDEIKEISEENEVLQDRFAQEILANKRVAQRIQQLKAVAGFKTGLDSALSQTPESEAAADDSIDDIAILRAEEPPAKTRALVLAFERRRRDPDENSRRTRLQGLSTLANTLVNIQGGEFRAAMNARGVQEKPLTDPDTLPVVVQLLADADSHVRSSTPILRLGQDSVIIDWAAWREAPAPLPQYGR